MSEDSRPTILLPGGSVPIQRSGRQLGEALAGSGKYLRRGGAVVTVIHDGISQPSLDILRPAALASVFEKVATLKKISSVQGEAVEHDAICSEQNAKLIMNCDAFQDSLPPLRLVSACPVLVERAGKLEQVSGYDRESGILAHGQAAPELAIHEATELLSEVLAEFQFATTGDRGRALAAMITPALVMSDLLGGRAPIDLGEADASQTGKGYRNKLTAAIYKHRIGTVTQKKGGVGSLEETFNTALIRGLTFISIDNVRGALDSPAIESFMTEDVYLARSPHMAAVEIDPHRCILQFTSNRAEITVDLANRSSCVRILKQPAGYCFRKYPEGDLLDHVRAHQPRYLGAVFAAIRAWHGTGKPQTNETRHDFRRWARTLDWIVQHLFRAGPLLDGHRETQARISTPSLTWLRDVALAVRGAGLLDQWLRAARLVEILAHVTPEVMEGAPNQDDLLDEDVRKKAQQAAGRRLAQCFGSSGSLSLDGFEILRRQQDDAQGARHAYWEYCIKVVPISPDGCAYAPMDDPPIGANHSADTISPGPTESNSPQAGSAATLFSTVCAYGAPKPAPMDVPMKPLIAPNAPMDSGNGNESTHHEYHRGAR